MRSSQSVQYHGVVRTGIAVILCALPIFASDVCRGQVRELKVRVIAPPSTPGESTIFIAGSSASFGNWDPGKLPMKRANDSVWVFLGKAQAGERVEFKITRGTWATEALYADGVIPPNTVVQILSDTVVTLRPVTWNDISPAKLKIASVSGITGMVKYHRGLAGEGLNHKRDVIVWLPPSYETALEKRYPVLYMHDGQNIFDPKTSFIGYDWRADEVADSLIKAGAIEEIIIVGISNSPDRIAEYSDTELGRNYARFVVERLKPKVDSLYRTQSAAQHTSVMGSSMGGLISLLFAWWYPDVFSMAGCLSTAIGRGRYDGILQEILKDSGPRKNLRFYIDVGGGESQLIPGYNLLVSTLEQKGYQKGVELESFFDPDAVHNEIAWAHRLWRPMEFFFGRK